MTTEEAARAAYALLSALPKSPQSILRLFADEGIKGILPADRSKDICETCIVSQYLAAHFPGHKFLTSGGGLSCVDGQYHMLPPAPVDFSHQQVIFTVQSLFDSNSLAEKFYDRQLPQALENSSLEN